MNSLENNLELLSLDWQNWGRGGSTSSIYILVHSRNLYLILSMQFGKLDQIISPLQRICYRMSHIDSAYNQMSIQSGQTANDSSC